MCSHGSVCTQSSLQSSAWPPQFFSRSTQVRLSGRRQLYLLQHIVNQQCLYRHSRLSLRTAIGLQKTAATLITNGKPVGSAKMPAGLLLLWRTSPNETLPVHRRHTTMKQQFGFPITTPPGQPPAPHTYVGPARPASPPQHRGSHRRCPNRLTAALGAPEANSPGERAAKREAFLFILLLLLGLLSPGLPAQPLRPQLSPP